MLAELCILVNNYIYVATTFTRDFSRQLNWQSGAILLILKCLIVSFATGGKRTESQLNGSGLGGN